MPVVLECTSNIKVSCTTAEEINGRTLNEYELIHQNIMMKMWHGLSPFQMYEEGAVDNESDQRVV